MKKQTAVALAVLALTACAAQAQSSVTMYGVVDLAVRYSNHHGPTGDDALTTVTSGGVAESRLGWNISEDLGAGLKAIANLEHRLQADTGAASAGPFFQQSWVGLQGDSFGRVTLGRQFNVLVDMTTTTFSSFKTVGPYLNSYKPEIALALGVRNDNQIKYALNLGGFTAEAQWSPDEGSGPSAATPALGKSWGAMAKYSFGSFAAGAGYLERKDAAGLKAEAYVVGGAYQAGPLYLNLSYGRNNFDDGMNTGLFLVGSGFDNAVAGVRPGQVPNDVKDRSMWSIGGTYELMTGLVLGAQYWKADQSYHTAGVSDGSGDFFALLADYSFSKRTAVYAAVEYTSLNDLQLTNMRVSPAAPNGADNRTALMVGIRHRF